MKSNTRQLKGLVTSPNTTGEELTPELKVTNYNSFYEFTTNKDGVKVEVGGLCHKPRTFDNDDIRRLALPEERVYRVVVFQSPPGCSLAFKRRVTRQRESGLDGDEIPGWNGYEVATLRRLGKRVRFVDRDFSSLPRCHRFGARAAAGSFVRPLALS